MKHASPRNIYLSLCFVLTMAVIFPANSCGKSVIIPEGSWIYKVLAELNDAGIPLVDEYYQPGMTLTRFDLADLLLRLEGQDFWPSRLKKIRARLTREFSWEMYLLSGKSIK
ncbi:MAG: hypothetical protein ACM3WV_09120 [Bacillota bacterium]